MSHWQETQINDENCELVAFVHAVKASTFQATCEPKKKNRMQHSFSY